MLEYSDKLSNSFFSLCFSFADDCKGKRQRKILYKTQNYLNLYAADGLRTLCIAKKVTMTFINNLDNYILRAVDFMFKFRTMNYMQNPQKKSMYSIYINSSKW